MNRRTVAGVPYALLAVTLIFAGQILFAQKVPGDKKKEAGSGATREAPLPASVSARAALSVVPGRPEKNSVALNILSNRDTGVSIRYGKSPERLDLAKNAVALTAGTPLTVILDGLEADCEYFYRVTAAAPAGVVAEGRFRTARPTGSTFSFEIIGDSHPERAQQFDPALYEQNLLHAAADTPDFFMTIGDDFSVDTLPKITKDAVDSIFYRQRLYLSVVGASAPVFLVNGNHEQASLANLDGTADNVAVWSQNFRNTYFAQPAPDSFYSGDAEKVDNIGFLEDYYAWTWGDALFVVIDPYWHSKLPVDNTLSNESKKTRDLWNNTLGETQYDWFKKTLEESSAKYKFVFSHHVLGTGRGGIECAPYYEWGGKSQKGQDEFAKYRPQWVYPVHRLMARTGVTAFIQGHDHIFAREILDGVSYITLPEPADPDYALYNSDAYPDADIAPNSGRVRFTVSPDGVLVEYIREWLPADLPPGAAAAAYSFVIPYGSPPLPGRWDPVQKSVAATPVTVTPPSGAKHAKGKDE